MKATFVLCLTLLLGACASSGGYRPQPFPGADAPPAGPADPSAPAAPGALAGPEAAMPILDGASATGYARSSVALSLRGAPYRDGGTEPQRGFDCSGFVRYVFAQNGVDMPRQTRDQFRIGQKVDRDELEPGDLVFFSTVAPGASHVGIALGAGQFVHAPSERGVVRVEQLSASYWARRYVGAKRVE